MLLSDLYPLVYCILLEEEEEEEEEIYSVTNSLFTQND
jgi:hypothetical protein